VPTTADNPALGSANAPSSAACRSMCPAAAPPRTGSSLEPAPSPSPASRSISAVPARFRSPTTATVVGVSRKCEASKSKFAARAVGWRAAASRPTRIARAHRRAVCWAVDVGSHCGNPFAYWLSVLSSQFSSRWRARATRIRLNWRAYVVHVRAGRSFADWIHASRLHASDQSRRGASAPRWSAIN